jgi:hypothetical protein
MNLTACCCSLRTLILSAICAGSTGLTAIEADASLKMPDAMPLQSSPRTSLLQGVAKDSSPVPDGMIAQPQTFQPQTFQPASSCHAIRSHSPSKCSISLMFRSCSRRA